MQAAFDECRRYSCSSTVLFLRRCTTLMCPKSLNCCRVRLIILNGLHCRRLFVILPTATFND